MTEAEWLTSDDPDLMLRALRYAVQHARSDRKARLLTVAVCRCGEYLLDETEYLALLGAVERVAEGKLRPASLARYRAICPPVPFGDQQLWYADSEKLNQANLLKHAVWLSGGKDLHHLEVCLLEAARGLHRRLAIHEGHRNQLRLVRDIFGNPFRPVSFAPDWRTSTVLSLAQHIYDSRDFSPMPILADALQDAGCDHDDILTHCRDANATHVRGCWVVDLILGKS